MSFFFRIYILLYFAILCSNIYCFDPRKDYKVASFPCGTVCTSLSTAECFPSSWQQPAAYSKRVSLECESVLYSVSLGSHVGGVPPIQDFWSGKPCSIMFLNSYSNFSKTTNLPNLGKYNNWTIIYVGHSIGYTSYRRAGKIPKLSPSSFFAENVKYAVYLDSKFILHTPPKILIQQYIAMNESIFLSAIHHPFSEAVENEIQNLNITRKTRPTVTDDFNQLIWQYGNYSSTRIFHQLKEHNLNQTMIEAGMLIHRVHHPHGNIFLCSWMDQVHKFSDRDQIALPFLVAWFNNFHFYPRVYYNSENSNYFLSPLEFPPVDGKDGDDEQKKSTVSTEVVYIHVISKRHYWLRDQPFGVFWYQPWHRRPQIAQRGKEKGTKPRKSSGSSGGTSVAAGRKNPQQQQPRKKHKENANENLNEFVAVFME